MDLHRYRANFPPTPAGTDITTLEFRVQIDGADSTLEGAVQDLGPEALSAEFEGPENALASLSLTYVDNAGNRSAPRTQTFTVLDDIAPSAPGDFGAIEHLSERTVPDHE